MSLRQAALLALPLFVVACGPEAQITRQPGSWSQKVEVLKLEGKGATPATRLQMQKMFDAMAAMSVCVTPAAVEKEDLAKNLEQMGARGQNCTFSNRDATGATIGFDAVCTQAGGGSMKLTARGNNAATEQDITMTMVGSDAAGQTQGTMEMRVRASRSGDCKPSDITPPDLPPGHPSVPEAGLKP
jgi:hypothetical protein